MTDIPVCKLCDCAPLSAGQLGEDVFVRHTENSCPVNSKRIFKVNEWTALMGVDRQAVTDPVDDHAAMRERQHIMITSQAWDRGQGTAFADGWTQCAYHYGIRKRGLINEANQIEGAA